MVSLTNQARLLAAQEFNRRVIAQRLAAGKGRTSAADIGRLTGVKPIVRAGRVVGLTTQKSATRLNTDRLLRAEIAAQARKRAQKSDLERFLANEQRLLSGNLSLSQVKADILRRKRKGLSKTPAQKVALAQAQGRSDVSALGARAVRKKLRGVGRRQIDTPSQTLAKKRAEAQRARGLGSRPFEDPVFEFGGRTQEEVIARGGTFGRRVAGGRTDVGFIGSQLGRVTAQRQRATSERISFAQSLLGDPFRAAPSANLLGLVGTRRDVAPKSLAARQREGVGFFETEAIPFTEKDAPKRERRISAVRARKIQDKAKATQARFELAQSRKRTDSIENIAVLGTQVFGRETRAGVDPRERLERARETQRETELLRASGLERPALVPATGVAGTSTVTFAPDFPRPRGRALQVSLQETLGFGDVLGARQTPRKGKGKRPKKATPTPTPTPSRSAFGIVGIPDIGGIPEIDIGALFAAPREAARGAVRATGRAVVGAGRGVVEDIGFGGALDFFGSELGRESFGEAFRFFTPRPDGGAPLTVDFTAIVPATGTTPAVSRADVQRDLEQTFGEALDPLSFLR